MSGPTPELTDSAEATGCLPFVVAALAAAASAAAMLPWGYYLAPFVFVGALILASFHVAILALPIYHTLACRYRVKFWMIITGAVLIGVAPATAVAILLGEWRNLPEVAVTFGFCGACGGLAFWLVLRLTPQ